MIKKIKNNLYFNFVVLVYIVFLFINKDLSITAFNNSGYYIKEMLMIMPVIFILTALLDTWVSRDAIIKYLGKDSKAKGVVFSFLLGSISAGPIYAAFPFCVMLHRKGASIKNIVIILSSWAVIKLPMLLNEMKFLGVKFMVIRWILTVIAIIIIATIMDKFIKNSDIKCQDFELKEGVVVNQNSCVGCSICTREYNEIFEMNNRKAQVKKYTELDEDKIEIIIHKCPVKAISYQK